jgi:MFS family permease
MAIGSEAMALAIGSEFTPVTASEEAAHQASSSESNGAAAAETSLEDTKEVDDAMSMPPKLSLCLILCMAFLTCANLVIVIPTATGYAQVLGGNSTLSGLLIGVTPILASFGVFGTYWVVKRSSFSTVIQCLNFGVVCGNILYALAELTGWPFTILFARSLIGFCGGLVIPPFYITQVVGIKRRSEVMFYFSAANVLGMAAGRGSQTLVLVFVVAVVIVVVLCASSSVILMLAFVCAASLLLACALFVVPR